MERKRNGKHSSPKCMCIQFLLFVWFPILCETQAKVGIKFDYGFPPRIFNGSGWRQCTGNCVTYHFAFISYQSARQTLLPISQIQMISVCFCLCERKISQENTIPPMEVYRRSVCSLSRFVDSAICNKSIDSRPMFLAIRASWEVIIRLLFIYTPSRAFEIVRLKKSRRVHTHKKKMLNDV